MMFFFCECELKNKDNHVIEWYSNNYNVKKYIFINYIVIVLYYN